MPNGENKEEPDEQKSTLDYILQRGRLPPDGYRLAGKRLYHAINAIETSVLSKHAPTICGGGFAALFLMILYLTPFSGIVPEVSAPVSVVLTGLLVVFVAVVIVRPTAEHVRRLIRQQDQLPTAVYLSNVGSLATPVISTPKPEQVKLAFEEIPAPHEFSETEQFDISQLWKGTTRDQVVVGEYRVSEVKPDDRILPSEDADLTATESVDILCDVIKRYVDSVEADVACQVLLRAREPDSDDVDGNKNKLKREEPLGLKAQLKRLLIEVEYELYRAIFGANEREALEKEQSAADEDRLDRYRRVIKDRTFGVTIRTVVVKNNSADEPSTVIEAVGDRIDDVTNQYVTVEQTTYSADSSLFQCELETILAQIRAETVVTRQKVIRDTLPLVSSTEIITGPKQVWHYCLLSTESGDNWTHETDPRDQQPTELPPEEKLDFLSPGESGDSRSREQKDQREN